MIVYISAGNSDDKLTQSEWAQFLAELDYLLQRHSANVHGVWYSAPVSPWQNACWCVELPDDDGTRAGFVKMRLAEIREKFRQDSVAWAEAPATVFL
jgi:hypothetical protein